MITRDVIILSTLEKFLPPHPRNLVKDYASEFQIKFSLPATTLHVMDQIGGVSHEFFSDSDYAAIWLKKFREDEYRQEMLGPLKRFQDVRKKYQSIPECFNGNIGNNGLFSPTPMEIADPIMDAFCSSDTISEAIVRLSSTVSQSDLDFLKDILTRFETKVKTIIDNLQVFSDLATDINSIFDKSEAAQHLNQMKQFYCSNETFPRSVTLIWAPGNPSGICYGQNVLVRVPEGLLQNKRDAKELYEYNVLMMSSIVVHETTHFISGNMPVSKKQELTQTFLKHKSIGNKPHFLFELEEPLVLATQMLFIKRNLSLKRSWFNDQLGKSFLSILEDHLQQKKVLDTEFIKKCAQISNLMIDNEESCNMQALNAKLNYR